MERWRSADGQATAEYVALVMLVAVALALAAGLSSGGIGGQVLAGLQRGVCRISVTHCPPPEPARPDLAPCPVERDTSRESLEGAFEVVRLGRDGTLTAERLSDGRVTVTLAAGTTAGGETGIGLRVALGGRAHGAIARASLAATIASGSSWTLPDAAAARAFVDRYGAKATIGGKAVDAVRSGCSLLCDAIGWRPHRQLPPPDELYMSHGLTARLVATLGPAGWSGSGSGVLGARLQRDGTSTWYLQLDAATSAGLDLPLAATALTQRGQAIVSYTLDPQRRPVSLGIHVMAQDGGRVGLAGAHGGGRAKVGIGDAMATEIDATLDLHDRANRAAATRFIAALRDPDALGELGTGAAAVRERIVQAGQIDRRTYAVSSSALEIGARVALGAELGGAFERTTDGMRLLTAETRLPGLPFLPRDDCRVA